MHAARPRADRSQPARRRRLRGGTPHPGYRCERGSAPRRSHRLFGRREPSLRSGSRLRRLLGQAGVRHDHRGARQRSPVSLAVARVPLRPLALESGERAMCPRCGTLVRRGRRAGPTPPRWVGPPLAQGLARPSSKGMTMTVLTRTLALGVLVAACGGARTLPANYAPTQAAISAADAVGARNEPRAALHLKMARDQLV